MTRPAGRATASPGTASPGNGLPWNSRPRTPGPGHPAPEHPALERPAPEQPAPGHCERHGVSLPDPAIQFPLRHPAVVSVVSGMRSGGQVASTLARFATVVQDEAWTELDAC